MWDQYLIVEEQPEFHGKVTVIGIRSLHAFECGIWYSYGCSQNLGNVRTVDKDD